MMGERGGDGDGEGRSQSISNIFFLKKCYLTPNFFLSMTKFGKDPDQASFCAT